MKVVQFLVKEVNQFPSDIECMRYIATITDKVSLTSGKDPSPIFSRNTHEKFFGSQNLSGHVCSRAFDSEVCACLLFKRKVNQRLESYSVELVRVHEQREAHLVFVEQASLLNFSLLRRA